MRGVRSILACTTLVLACIEAEAQEANQVQQGPRWSFDASASVYLIPDDSDYLQPTVMADRGWLHLEARYNYEDLRTASAWVGYNFSVGQKVSFSVTPIIGGVFGRTAGIASGFHVTLDWRRVQLYSEDEWVLNTRERADSFFYSWSEATLAPWGWLQAGFVGQRTRAYQSARDTQPGFLVRVNSRWMSLTANVFNPDKNPLYVISVDVEY